MKMLGIISTFIQILKLIWRFIMAMFSVNPHRMDPYKNFKFRVKWDARYINGISKISPLTRSTEPVRHRNGGDQSNPRLSPGTTNFSPIIMERGLSHDASFEEWANMVFDANGDSKVSLKSYKKTVVIELLNLAGEIVMAFNIYNCWISEYQPLPELDANGKCIAIEKIVLQHDGWERDIAITEPSET